MIKKTISFLFENSIFLISGTILALVWANVDHESYEHFAHSKMHFVVNDILMVFFFGMAAKEIWEALLPGGDLSSFKKAATPVIATIGGVTGPAVLYYLGCLYLNKPELIKGWAVPTATDIAFCYMTARMVFGKNHSAVTFLLALAIIDDAIGLAIIAIFYSGAVNIGVFFIFVGGGILTNKIFKKCKVKNFWPYIIVGGGLSWYGFHIGGIHPALALVPIIPTLPHSKGDEGFFAELDDDEAHRPHDTLNEFEHWFKNPVEIFLFLFGLVNAGVVINSTSITAKGTWIVAMALLIGKPAGVFLFGSLATLFGFKLPDGMTKKHLLVAGIAAGIGFTVAIFVSTVAFKEGGQMLDNAKMGALLSFGAAPLAIIVAKIIGLKKSEL